jgi:hypothetical protein
MNPKITPDIASKILDKDDVNAVERASKGTPLSKEQRARLEKVAKRTATIKLPKQIETAAIGKAERGFLTAQRRNRVYSLRIQGLTLRQMAEILDCRPATVMKDCHALDAALAKTINTTNAAKHLNELLWRWEGQYARCEREIENGLSGSELAQAHSAQAVALKEIAKLKQDAGIIPKVPTQLEHSGPDSQPMAMGRVVLYLPDNGRGPLTDPEKI